MIAPIEDWQIFYVMRRVEQGIYRKRVPLNLMLQAIARIEQHKAQMAAMDGIRRNLLTRIANLNAVIEEGIPK